MDISPAAAVQGTSDGKYREKGEESKKNAKAGDVKPVKVPLFKTSSIARFVGLKKLSLAFPLQEKKKKKRKRSSRSKSRSGSPHGRYTNLFLESRDVFNQLFLFDQGQEKKEEKEAKVKITFPWESEETFQELIFQQEQVVKQHC